MIVPCIVNSWLYCSLVATLTFHTDRLAALAPAGFTLATDVAQELQPRHGQLGAHQQRQRAADHEESERRDQVEIGDLLRVRGVQHRPAQQHL